MSEMFVKDITPKEKRIIVNLAGEIAPDLIKVFESFNCELISETTAGAKVDFILTRDVPEGYAKIAERYQTIKLNIPIISLKEIENRDEFLLANGRGWINEKILLFDQFLEIFDRYFNKTSSLHLEDIYSNLKYKTEVIKLTSHMNIGYYMDLIGTEALIKGHNIVNIRKYFLNAVTYLGYLHSSELGRFPIDIDYMIKNDRVDLQMYCSVENFHLEYLQSALKTSDRINPLKGTLEQCLQSADFFDVYHLSKSAKLVLWATFLKDEICDKTKGYFPSMLLNQIDSFKQFQLKEKERLINIKLGKDGTFDSDLLGNEKLPGEGIEICVDKRLREIPPLFEKVVDFIKYEHKNGGSTKDLIELECFDIQAYLEKYPTLEEIDFLNVYDYEDIISALVNSVEFVLNIERKPSIKGTDHLRDEFTRISGSKDQKDGMYIIRGAKTENDQGRMRVSSLKKDKNEDEDFSQEDSCAQESKVVEVTEVFEKRIEQNKQGYEKRIQALLRELEETKFQVRNTAQDKADIERLSKENNDYKNSLETSMKRIEILSDKLDKVQGGKVSNQGMQNIKSEESDDADDALKRQYNKIKRESEDRLIEIKRLELCNRQLEGDLKRLSNQLEKSSESLDENKDGEAKLRGMEIEVKNLKVEVGNKEKTVQLLTQRVKALTEQIARVQEDSKTAKPVDNGKIAKIENRMKQVDIANQNLTKERDALKKEVADKKKDVVALQKENQTLRNQNQELERKLKVEKSKQAA